MVEKQGQQVGTGLHLIGMGLSPMMFMGLEPKLHRALLCFFGGDKSIGDIYGVVFSELVYILFLLAAVTHMVVEVCVSGFKPGPNWTSAVLNWLSNPYLAFWPPCSPGHEC